MERCWSTTQCPPLPRPGHCAGHPDYELVSSSARTPCPTRTKELGTGAVSQRPAGREDPERVTHYMYTSSKHEAEHIGPSCLNPAATRTRTARRVAAASFPVQHAPGSW